MAKTQHSDSDHDPEVAELVKILDKMVKDRRSQGFDPDEWLRTLHRDYSNRFLSDNDRIWTVGSILIPVSVAGYAALVTIENPRLWHVLILALGSISLLFIWEKIADRHREFQRKWNTWLRAIECTIGLSAPINGGETVPLRKWRWGLFYVVLFGWVVILILSILGYLQSESSSTLDAAQFLPLLHASLEAKKVTT